MTPYYSDEYVTIYCGDAREIVTELPVVESCITDPVWPNSVFPGVKSPMALARQVFYRVKTDRLVVQLGCNSDPRFLNAVPERFEMFRVCWLEYAQCSYIGRLLYTGDVAYVFGKPPAAKPGAMVLPGKVLSSKSDGKRATGRKTHKSRNAEVYKRMPHPTPRNLVHVKWLVKWFGGASVLDPFMGSGTTAVACKDMGIPFIGIEIEERFCELAVNRIKQTVLDLQEA